MKPQVRQWLRKTRNICGAIVAGMIILLALVFSAIRLLLPLANDYRADIEQLASARLGQTVIIETIETDWKWFRPRLKLINVEVRNQENFAALANVEQVLLGVNLFRSMVQRAVEIDDVTIVGTDISVRRDSKQQLFVQGVLINLEQQQTDARPMVLPSFLLNRTIRVVQSEVELEDQPGNVAYRLQAVNLAARFKRNKYDMYFSADLPPELGNTLELGLELNGALTDLSRLAGKVYVSGENINLPVLFKNLNYGGNLQSARADINAWIDLDSEKGHAFTGTLDLKDLTVNLPDANGKPAKQNIWSLDGLVADIQGSYNKSGLWLDAENILMTNDGVERPSNGINLRTSPGPQNGFQKGELAFEFLSLQDVEPLLALLPEARQWLEKIGVSEIRGDIFDFYLRWDQGNTAAPEKKLTLQTNFNGLDFTGNDKIPGIKGLKGSLHVHNLLAELQLDTQLAAFHYPRYFRHPLPISKLKGRVLVSTEAGKTKISARDLHLNTPHLHSRHWLDLHLQPDEAPVINQYAVYSNGDASAAPLYLPAGIMNEKSLAWLDNAFVGGRILRGEFELSGPLDKFPFADNEGIFRVEFDADQGALKYFKDWPVASQISAHVRFFGPSLFAVVHDARIYDSRVIVPSLKIENLKRVRLEIEGHAYGTVAEGISFVNNTSLRNLFVPVIDQVEGGGMQATDIYFDFPLYAGGEKEYRLSTSLYDAELNFASWGLNFSDISTRLDYGGSTVNSPPFEMLLNKQPAIGLVETLDTGVASVVHMHVSVKTSLRDLLARHNSKILDAVQGETEFRADLNIGLRHPPNKKLQPRLAIASDLLGLDINLPEPFNKPPAVLGDFDLMLEFNSSESIAAQLEYADWLRGAAVLSAEKNKIEIKRADLRVMAGVPDTPADEGIYIKGRLEHLNVDKWLGLRLGDNNKDSLLNKVQKVNVQVGQLYYLRRKAEEVNVSISRQLHNWNIELFSEVISGNILIPNAGFEKRGLAINLDYLDFDQLNEGVGKESVSPGDVPPFQLRANKMLLNEWQLENVRLLVEPMQDGAKIHSLYIEDPDIGLSGEGEWLLAEDGQQSTSMNLRFNSQNVGSGISKLGYAEVIRGGKGTAEFNVQWPGTPSQFDLGTFAGEASIAIENGQILDIEPGGGRLFGLLSLQTIPRRLALDFSDIFDKGFAFDKMKGSFEFADGNANTSDYYIDGPTGRIDIEGRTGLVQRDYDQRILFRPDLSSSLPLIGTLLGGATAGVVVIVADRIARVFGRQADDLARFQYTMTGSWDEPRIAPVVNKTKGNSETAAKSTEAELKPLPPADESTSE